MTKKVISKKKVIRFSILIGIIVVVIIGGIFLIKHFMKAPRKTVEPPKVVDEIKDYGYELAENETAYYKQLFESLKKVVGEEDKEEEYAKLVAQLFTADFFNLDNKITKNDIGGTQFVYKDYQSDFEKYAQEGIYHYVESNIYNDRKQELPIVSNVIIDKVEQKSYSYLDKSDKNAYFIDVTIEYQKDLGYQTHASYIVVHNNNRLEIVKMTEQ